MACGSASYLAQASVGQLRLLLDREPLDEARIASLSDDERRGVDALRRALALADQLGLAPSKSYRQLIDRGDRPLVTVVVAAPVDRVEPVTWWFPIVGRVPYRGYFDPEGARRSAERLAARGLDTYVRPAALYSSLGWFDDPIPRALLGWDPVLLGDTILHERVHETVFVPGDVAYNEGLATFVAHRGTLALLAGQPEEQERARRRFADEMRFADLLERLAGDLESLYGQASDPEQLRSGREAIFGRYREREFAAVPWQTARFDRFRTAPLSNAYVVAHRTYLGDLACFERELDELGGNLGEFVARHREQPGRHLPPDVCPPPGC